MATPHAPPILLVEDDDDIREVLAFTLGEEGYQPVGVGSLAEAFARIDTATFALILTDVFRHDREQAQALAPLGELRVRAAPTPVGIVSGWSVTEAEASAAGFAFLMRKPFDIDELVTAVAAAVATPLSAEEHRRAHVVREYFARLSARDWAGVADLCTEDVTYVLPGKSPFAATIEGKAAFQAFTAETFGAFPDAHFDDLHIYATPHGLAARYRSTWHTGVGGDGNREEHHQAGAVVFAFTDTAIRQIGVRLNAEHLQTLMSPT